MGKEEASHVASFPATRYIHLINGSTNTLSLVVRIFGYINFCYYYCVLFPVFLSSFSISTSTTTISILLFPPPSIYSYLPSTSLYILLSLFFILFIILHTIYSLPLCTLVLFLVYVMVSPLQCTPVLVYHG